jgi:hypothetical protein
MMRVMLMKRLILNLCLIVASVIGAADAIAQCTCVPTYVNITPHNEFKLASVVLIGEILEIKKTDLNMKTGHYTEIIKVKVKKAWKRDIESAVTIRNRVVGCINGFKEKEEWLLYVYKDQDGTLGTYCCCSRTRPVSKAIEDLKEFEEKGEMPAKVFKDPLQESVSLTSPLPEILLRAPSNTRFERTHR